MKRLSVNIDHVATIREARKTFEPNPVTAALLCELAGAHGDGYKCGQSRGRGISIRHLFSQKVFPLRKQKDDIRSDAALR